MEKIQGVQTQPLKDLVNQSPSIRDVGVDYINGRLGGCSRSLWYRINDITETNKEKDHLVIADHITASIKKILLEKIQRVIRPLSIEPYGWYVPTEKRNIWCYLDGMITAGIDVPTVQGVLIFTGSGYGFRAEVFGTKTKNITTAGSIKEGHLLQAWITMLLFPEKLGKIDSIEVIYYDRGQLDAISYMVDSCPIDKKDVIQSIVTSSGPSIPTPSYEKQWKSRELVAKLYARKKITKEKYETWMESGVGGDWQCQYCQFLDQCKKDDGSY